MNGRTIVLSVKKGTNTKNTIVKTGLEMAGWIDFERVSLQPLQAERVILKTDYVAISIPR